jgi:hypothetical protein
MWLKKECRAEVEKAAAEPNLNRRTEAILPGTQTAEDYAES